jgi:Tol biopolymer transport system component
MVARQIVSERDVFAAGRISRALIETMSADGSSARPLTSTGFSGSTSWSPDGKQIVYSTLQSGDKTTLSIIPINRSRGDS